VPSGVGAPIPITSLILFPQFLFKTDDKIFVDLLFLAALSGQSYEAKPNDF
jgi:hypothetical protein